MNLLERISEYSYTNIHKKIAMFVDMDGVIATLEIDVHNDIAKNKPKVFLDKKPMKTVINLLQEVSKLPNIDLYILSACGYKGQAADKAKWLEKQAPFFKSENQIFVIKEVVNYTMDNKSEIKTKNIVDIMEKRGYDLSIYLDDEYLMLKKAYKLLKDKVWCIHISEFIE